jgi:hypothetical protein
MRSLRAGVNSEVPEVKVRKLGAGVRSLLAMQPRQNELVYRTTLQSLTHMNDSRNPILQLFVNRHLETKILLFELCRQRLKFVQ